MFLRDGAFMALTTWKIPPFLIFLQDGKQNILVRTIFYENDGIIMINHDQQKLSKCPELGLVKL